MVREWEALGREHTKIGIKVEFPWRKSKSNGNPQGEEDA